MHILIIPSWYPTKNNSIAGIFFREQAHALKKTGHQVGVIFPERKALNNFRFRNIKRTFSQEDDDGIATIRTHGWYWFPKIPHGNAYQFIKDGNELFERYLKQYGKPDIIHAHSMLYGGVLAAKINKKNHIPFVVTEHSTAFARGLIKNWKIRYLHEVYESASKLISVSPELGILLNQQYGCPNRIIQFVPNIVNTEFFIPANKPTLKTDKLIFLTVSLLTYKKGHHILLESFANCLANKPNIELWIGGDGEEKTNLVKQVGDLGINHQVKFLGALSRDQVRDVMQRCDVFVLPSLYETFGVVVIEAMACGKPVLATRCGGPECIINDINGMLVAANEIDDLARAMEKLIKNIDKYDPELIRQDCISRFSEEAVTNQLINIYETILKSNKELLDI